MRLARNLVFLSIVALSGCVAPGMPYGTEMPVASNCEINGCDGSLRQQGLVTLAQSPDWNQAPEHPIRAVACQTSSTAADAPQQPTVVQVACTPQCQPMEYTTVAGGPGPIRRYLRTVLFHEPEQTQTRLVAVPMPQGAMPVSNWNASGVVVSSTVVETVPQTVEPAHADKDVQMVEKAPVTVITTERTAFDRLPVGAQSPGQVMVMPRKIETGAVAPRTAAPMVKTESAAEEVVVPPGAPIHVVSEHSIRLNCKLRDVGPSGVSAVDLWFTQDGRHWRKTEQPLSAQPPYVLDVKEDGRYGITLIPHSGAGVCRQPPMLGEQPQIWVDVDTTRPVVKIGQVKFVFAGQEKEVSINWVAQDRNFTVRPIRLSYAEKPDGPWRIIAETENTGTYQWRVPAQAPRAFFVRVEASDTAGNVGTAFTTDPVVLDLSRPAIDILSVESNRKR
jgi:hypothetical protein